MLFDRGSSHNNNKTSNVAYVVLENERLPLTCLEHNQKPLRVWFSCWPGKITDILQEKMSRISRRSMIKMKGNFAIPVDSVVRVFKETSDLQLIVKKKGCYLLKKHKWWATQKVPSNDCVDVSKNAHAKCFLSWEAPNRWRRFTTLKTSLCLLETREQLLRQVVIQWISKPPQVIVGRACAPLVQVLTYSLS